MGLIRINKFDITDGRKNEVLSQIRLNMYTNHRNLSKNIAAHKKIQKSFDIKWSRTWYRGNTQV